MTCDLPFVPVEVRVDYATWLLLPDILPQSFPGVKTSRDEAVTSIDRRTLEMRFQKYFDPNVTNDDLAEFAPALMGGAKPFDPQKVRAVLVERGVNCGEVQKTQ